MRPGLCIPSGADATDAGVGDTAQRATFIIDGDGTVAHVIPRVSPRTHDDEVLAALEQLAAA
jgi:peroxiredoxin